MLYVSWPAKKFVDSVDRQTERQTDRDPKKQPTTNNNKKDILISHKTRLKRMEPRWVGNVGLFFLLFIPMEAS